MTRTRRPPTGPHKEFALRFREALDKAGMNCSQEQIGKIFNVSQVSAASWLSGEKLPSRDNALKISKKLKVSTDWLLSGKAEAEGDFHTNFAIYPSPRSGKDAPIPLISFDRAGDWCDVEDPYQLNDAERWLDSPIEHGSRAFCLRIEGDSMDDKTPYGYPDGCIAQFDPDIQPKHKDDVVVRTPDNKTTFKQLQITPEGMFLVALNPDFPNRVIKVPEGTVIVAVCQGFWMERRRRR